MPKPVINSKKCNGCGQCVNICSRDVFGMEKGKAVVMDEKRCFGCRACEVQCPRNAINVEE